MRYDIAAKVLMEKCRGEILRRFLGLSVSGSSLLEQLPQETVSLKRSDFPILVRDEAGARRLVLLEIQSRWDRARFHCVFWTTEAGIFSSMMQKRSHVFFC